MIIIDIVLNKNALIFSSVFFSAILKQYFPHLLLRDRVLPTLYTRFNGQKITL
jgi:hypothetical protein